MKAPLIVALLVGFAADATDGPTIGPGPPIECGGEVRRIYAPTPACGFNDLGIPNMGSFEEYSYWNGFACVATRRFVSCSGGG